MLVLRVIPDSGNHERQALPSVTGAGVAIGAQAQPRRTYRYYDEPRAQGHRARSRVSLAHLLDQPVRRAGLQVSQPLLS